MEFQGKSTLCGRCGQHEVYCWAKYGKPKAEEQNNQPVDEVKEYEEEVTLLGLRGQIEQGHNIQENEKHNHLESNQEYDIDGKDDD